jgi:hypothetical protein
MALQAGDKTASSGMSMTIYQKINEVMSPDIGAGTLPKAQESWKKLAFAIASGVIASIKSDMEIAGIQASGNFTAPVTGTVAGTAVTGTSTGSVSTSQTGLATGHVS